MVHVSDVERSAEYYRLLGFEVGNSFPREGKPTWVWMYQPRAESWKRGANLMLATSERPVNPGAQDVLFYLYAADLVALRNQLLERGVKVSEIEYPFYMPKGEFRTHDPDGYCLMIGQSYEGSP